MIRTEISPQRKRRGLTLIELVIVLIIIATLAGLVIPQMGMLGRSSDMAASAKTQADLSNNVQLFFVMQKRYPQGFDSLLDSTGAIYSSDTTLAETQSRGLPYSGSDGFRMQSVLTSVELENATNAEYLRSFVRSGFDYLYDHDTAALNSNNSTNGSARRYCIAEGSNAAPSKFKVAEVTNASFILKLVPDGLATGQRLVAVGVGGRNSAISKTITNCPTYPGCDGKYYGRYIAIFKIYASGERATMVGVVDSYGRTPDYTQQQFNESMPDGGRQG